MADTGERCEHKRRVNEVVQEVVDHVDRKQSMDASVQTMQFSIVIVTTVTKETICKLGLSEVYTIFLCSGCCLIGRCSVSRSSQTRVIRHWLSLGSPLGGCLRLEGSPFLGRDTYTLPPMHQLPIPFPASMDRQMPLPKGGEPEPSSVPMVIQPSLCVEE